MIKESCLIKSKFKATQYHKLGCKQKKWCPGMSRGTSTIKNDVNHDLYGKIRREIRRLIKIKKPESSVTSMAMIVYRPSTMISTMIRNQDCLSMIIIYSD